MNYRSVAALAAFVLLPVVALAQSVQPGMHFTGTLKEAISSKTATVGQRVTLTNVRSTDNSIANATMHGHVVSVSPASQGHNADIFLGFDTLRLSDGSSYSIAGEVEQLQQNTANNGAKEAVGTVGGMIVGNILGKWLGTNLGGLLGAAGGYVIAKNNREDVTIPANSSVSVHLVAPRRQEHDPNAQNSSPPPYAVPGENRPPRGLPAPEALPMGTPLP